jgi:hypothetical protein
MDRKNILKRLVFLILFIFILNFAATNLYWYSSLAYLDMIMHFLGGFWVALAGFYVFSPKINSIFNLLFFVLLVGLGWEFYEILVNDVIAQNPFDYGDSLSDIFFDLFGGLCAILYLWKKQPN